MRYNLNVTENKNGEVFYNGTDLSYDDALKAISIHLGYSQNEAKAMISDAHISSGISFRPSRFFDLYSPKGVFVTATVGLVGEPE